MFNLINGVFAPDSGRVIFRGADITGRPPYRVARARARAHAPDRAAARDHERAAITASSAPASAARTCRCRARAKPRARPPSWSASPTALDTLASQLTIAGKKRLELARALAAQPTLLLLDEVLAGLNPTEVERMIEIIRRSASAASPS